MSNALLEPAVPPELLPFWDDHARDAYSRLAHRSLEQVIETMPPTQYMGIDDMRYVDLSPAEDHDRETAIAFTLPFTNGWKPHTAIRAAVMQNMLPTATRVIAFPDSTPSQSAYELTDKDRAIVARGGFDPIAEKQANTLEQLGVKRLHVIGYSFGASVGAASLRLATEHDRFEVANSGLFEPPNCLTRSVVDLEKGFFKTSLKDLNGDINNSALPALTDAQRANGGFNNFVQTSRISKDWLISWLDETMRTVKHGMATDTFVTDVHAALRRNQSFLLTIAGGSKSSIFPLATQRHLARVFAAQKRYEVTIASIEGKKHTMGDNVILHGLLARAAITAEPNQVA